MLLYNKFGTLTRFNASHSLGQRFERKFSRLPSLSDNKAHADSKISNLPNKIWRSKRGIFVVVVAVVVLGEKMQAQQKTILFFREKPEK